MLLNLIASCLFACAVGVGSTTNDSPYLNAKKYVSYNDEGYSITLNADELNNYTYTNFATLIEDVILENYIATLTYNNETYDADTLYYYVYDENYKIELPNETHNNKFRYIDDYEGDVPPFEFSLKINCSEDYYADIKQAIELDIQANSEPDYSQFATDAIDLLVGSIGGIATGIGTGLSSLISYLAISGTSMSPFMAVVFVLGGIALAFGLSRWVVNLLTSLGQRNR